MQAQATLSERPGQGSPSQVHSYSARCLVWLPRIRWSLRLPKSSAPVGCYTRMLLSLLDIWPECQPDPAHRTDTLQDRCQPGFLAAMLTETREFPGARILLLGDTCGCPPSALSILPFLPELTPAGIKA